MDDSNEDQRLPHHKEPKEFVSIDQLAGKVFWRMCQIFLSADFTVYIQILGFNMLTMQNLESLAGA